MAISFSRPDPSSPAAVGSAAFPTNRRGFDQGEVRDFLRMVAAELARLQERERFLENELRTMQTRGMSAPGRLDEETVTTLLGEEAARVLSTARDASTQIRDRAEESATRLVKDAAEDAARIRESAMIEAARINEDAAHDAEAEIEMAKQQGRDMVNEARAYREKVLSELSRRRDAARGQIEQLLHGRDRLLNAFERARLASEDVINGLTEAHDEPEFIVDLTPTTGPVPIVNPEHSSAKVFDHETADVVETVEVSTTTTTIIFDHDTAEVVKPEIVETEIPADVIIDFVEPEIAAVEVSEPEIFVEEVMEVADVIAEAVEEIIETAVISAEHPVHGMSRFEEITGELPVVEETPADTNQTNVVSLFGRGRRGTDGPEVVEVPEVIAPVEVVEEKAPKATSGVDDIFAKLRAGTTADVATKVETAEPVVQAEPAFTEAFAKEVIAKEAAPKKKSKPKQQIIAADPARFAERDEALSGLVVTMARKLKRVLADEQNNVLEHLRGKRSSLEMDAILGTADEQAVRYAQSIAEDTMAAAGSGAKSVKSAGGSSRRVTQKAVSSHVKDSVMAGLVAGFREDTRIAIGEAEGDREILASLMRDVYRKWKTDLIDQRVDDLACTSYSKGGFLALDPQARVSWMVDPDAECCSECEDNSLAGAVTKGEEFPTGHAMPPAHPGCRCLVCPVQD
jgi:DivIVA domain-containing protein